MAITYKGSNKSLSHLYIYDSSAGTYSSNYAGVNAHDLFPDDATVDDIIYFGATEKFSDLYFNIGTALVATSITLVWEYWDSYAGSWQTLTVTDNTNSFQTTGANTVLFGVPVRWGIGYSTNNPKPNGVTGRLWIRCRITAVTGLTEGGANQTTAIYGKLAKIVVTGSYTDLMPSLYSADVAGGWGVILRQVMFDNYDYNYGVVVPIDIGDGSTSTTVTLKNNVVELMSQAVIKDTANSVFTVQGSFFIVHATGEIPVTEYLQVSYGSITRVGWMEHHNDFPGYGGCAIKSANSFTDSLVITGRQQRWGGYGPGVHATSGTNKNLILNVGSSGKNSYYGGTVDNLIINTAIGFPSGSGRIICHNVYTYSSGDLLAYMDRASYTHIIFDNLQAPNSDVSNPAKYLTYNAQLNDIYVAYAFKLKVIDKDGNPIQGATVTIQNEQNTQNYGFNYTNGNDNSGPLTTDANGEISQIVLIHYKHYNSTRTGSWKYCDTTVDYGKSTVTISKPGYQTKTIIYTMDRKREEIEVLEKAVPVYSVVGDDVKQVANAKPADNQNKVLLDVLE